MKKMGWQINCVECGAEYPALEVRYRCVCGGTLEVNLGGSTPLTTVEVDARRGGHAPLDRSGVWRFPRMGITPR